MRVRERQRESERETRERESERNSERGGETENSINISHYCVLHSLTYNDHIKGVRYKFFIP